jgi:hypothetical protein
MPIVCDLFCGQKLEDNEDESDAEVAEEECCGLFGALTNGC